MKSTKKFLLFILVLFTFTSCSVIDSVSDFFEKYVILSKVHKNYLM